MRFIFITPLRFGILLGLLSIFLLNGCNTMQGLGKDIEKSGETLQDSASKNKNY